jgi:hypothetical protein
VKERTWHATQQFKDRADGSTVMTLDVTDDYALRNWILGFPAACLLTAMFSRRCRFCCRVLRTRNR